MTIIELRQRYIDTLPFTERELSDDLLTKAFRDAVNIYNKYDPRTKIESLFVLNRPYTFPPSNIPECIFRIYYYAIGAVPDTTNASLVWDWIYEKPDLWIDPGDYILRTGYNWTLGTVSDAILDEKDLLSKFVEIHIKMYAANRRRKGGQLPDLPIDFQGDALYSEAYTEFTTLKEEIQQLSLLDF